MGQPRGDRERPRGSPRIGENGRAAITLRASGSPACRRMRTSLPRSFTVDQVTNLPTPGRQLDSRIDRWKNVDFSRDQKPRRSFSSAPKNPRGTWSPARDGTAPGTLGSIARRVNVGPRATVMDVNSRSNRRSKI